MDECPFRFDFKSVFNSPAKVLAVWALENISSAANCLAVDTIWFDRSLM